MKKLKINERTELIIFCTLAAVIFLIAALMPLRFQNEEALTTSEMSMGERAAIFSAYWNEPDGSRVSMESGGKLDESTRDACEARMAELLTRCTIDRENGAAKKEGSEYFVLTSKGGEVNVCRKWVEWQGDWRNWLDTCFDADSGELYYLYLSAECLSGYTNYVGALPAQFGAAYVAEMLADEMDYELLYLDVPDDEPNSIIASYNCGGSALRLCISCIYHETVLVDVKICCEM